MKTGTDTFLSESDRERIRAAVKAAEAKTSGEIVPMVVPASYHYPVSDILGAAAIAFPLSIVLTYVICGMLWLGDQNMWLFIGLFSVLFFLVQQLIKRIAPLKRLFISRREIDEEVEEAAITAFFREGLYRTRDETGVLVFISVFERKVWVLADRGINAKVEKSACEKIVSHIVEGIRKKRQADAICEAVTMIGDLLSRHFPVKEDDTNELKDLIVE